MLAAPSVAPYSACRTDAVRPVIELGDGQVSDRHASTPPTDLIDVPESTASA
jgi:hypothetical protein